MREGCEPRRIAAAIVRFFDAFASGDPSAVGSAIADSDRFQGYNTTEAGHGGDRSFTALGLRGVTDIEGGVASDQRPRLLKYLRVRRSRGERMALLEVEITAYPPRAWFPAVAENVAGVELTFRREAPDFAVLGGTNRIATGKGALSCRDRRLLLWATGLNTARRPPARSVYLCPTSKRLRHAIRRKRAVVVACNST